MDSGLWLIILEAALALGLLAFIVWWTMPRRDGKARKHGDR